MQVVFYAVVYLFNYRRFNKQFFITLFQFGNIAQNYNGIACFRRAADRHHAHGQKHAAQADFLAFGRACFKHHADKRPVNLYAVGTQADWRCNAHHLKNMPGSGIGRYYFFLRVNHHQRITRGKAAVKLAVLLGACRCF